MITRRGFLLIAGIGLIAAHGYSAGQSATIRRVGWLSLGTKASTAEVYEAFKQGMHDLGWFEGKNVEYQILYAGLDVGSLDALASQLIRTNVHVIVVGNATTARALQRVNTTVAVVMANVNNPVGNRFVASLAKPGGNMTGITTQSEEVLGKLIGILHEVTPGARRVAIMLNESNPNHPVFWAAAQRACTALDLMAIRVVASSSTQLSAAVEQIVRQRSQAVVVVVDPLYLYERAKLQALMQATRLPVAYGWREHVVAGGLLSYAPDLVVTFRNAATYVDKILKGAKPADLPVGQATKFDLVINAKTAKTLGITIPKDMLLRANEVIQ